MELFSDSVEHKFKFLGNWNFSLDATIISHKAFAPNDITAISEPAAEGKEIVRDVKTPVNNITSPVIDPTSLPARTFSSESSFTRVLSTPAVRREKTQRRQTINSKDIKKK